MADAEALGIEIGDLSEWFQVETLPEKPDHAVGLDAQQLVAGQGARSEHEGGTAYYRSPMTKGRVDRCGRTLLC